MKIIGLTGGIASGKSHVAQLFGEHGAVVLDADRHAHAALSDAEVLQQLSARFGAGILNDDGSLKRNVVAQRVFGDDATAKSDREFLEGLIHPRVRKRLHAELDAARANGAAAAVLDIPLLHEAGWADECDLVMFIDTPDRIRASRAAQRGWSPEELASREAAQLPISEKRARADHTIPGDDSADVGASVARIWDELVSNR